MRLMTTTHTYAVLEVTQSTYDEIKQKLTAAGYQHQFYKSYKQDEKEIIDMHGIALQEEKQ